MGPRLQERGVGYQESQELPKLRQLQWGRAYKSAEFLAPVEASAQGETLQWGRAYKSAELAGGDCQQSRETPASMGPRLQERGVSSRDGHIRPSSWSFNGAALTRARSYSNLRMPTKPRWALQWGRAYKSAELQVMTMKQELRERLQWGRAYKSAELGDLPDLLYAVDGGFNGAALTRARSSEAHR